MFNNQNIKQLQSKVDSLTQEIATIKETIASLLSIPSPGDESLSHILGCPNEAQKRNSLVLELVNRGYKRGTFKPIFGPVSEPCRWTQSTNPRLYIYDSVMDALYIPAIPPCYFVVEDESYDIQDEGYSVCVYWQGKWAERQLKEE